jgi:hypothetical protein
VESRYNAQSGQLELRLDRNDEITLGMMDAPLAREFEAIERDSKECVELELATWRRRGRCALT